MSSSYVLRIDTAIESVGQIDSIVGQKSTRSEPFWELEIDESSDMYIGAISYLSGLVEQHMSEFKSLRINSEDISIWYFYEYTGQCNMEFGSDDLKKMGELGITLCISCWEE